MGPAAKEAMLKGDTFGASILYAGDEAGELPPAADVQALIHPED